MYRTDLAIERMEMAESEGAQACDNSGVTMEKTDYGSDVTATMITIIDESLSSSPF